MICEIAGFMVQSTPFKSFFGEFELYAMSAKPGSEHVGLLRRGGERLVRLQSSCATGELHALLCDCRQQLEAAVEVVGSEGGLFLLLDQEGRGHGLGEKVAQLKLIADGANTESAARMRGLEPDVRTYSEAAVIIEALLGPGPVKLMTNNPKKLELLVAEGIEVSERLPLVVKPHSGNAEYLAYKRDHMGHLLP